MPWPKSPTLSPERRPSGKLPLPGGFLHAPAIYAVSLYPSCAGMQPADSSAALFTPKSFGGKVVKGNYTKK